MADQRYAILIGNSEFPHETGLTELRCPPLDVRGLAAVLEDTHRGHFQVTTLVNQTKQNIERQLLGILNQAQKDDLVLIYFSGHGWLNRAGQLHLAAHDTELGLLQATAVAASQIKTFIDDSYCNRIILILDCCHSGAIGDAFMAKGGAPGQVNQVLTELAKNEADGLHIMTASTSVQSAYEKDGELYSVFTTHLIGGMETGAADKHAKGVVSFNDLFGYIEGQLKKEGKQKPLVFNIRGADLKIAHSGKNSRKERREMISPFLLGLLNEQRLTAKVYAEAIGILETPEARLTGLEKHRDLLMAELYAKEMESALFLVKWSDDGFKDPNPIIKILKQTITAIKFTNKRFFVVAGSFLAIVITAGWATGVFSPYFSGQKTIEIPSVEPAIPISEQQSQIVIAKAKEEIANAEAYKLAMIEAKAKKLQDEQMAAEAELAAKQAQEQKTKAIEPNMVAIPAGSFLMGSPATEQGRDKDEPQHTVSVSTFYMGQTEVTKGQFGAFVAATNYLTEAEQGDGCYGWTGTEWAKDKKFNWQNAGFAQTDQHPVVCVSWNDAQAYIAWLNKETGKSYHLPTEAEWEYAARAGTTTPFSFGDNITPEQVNYDGNYPYAGGAKGLYRVQTVPVKSLPPNPWGLYEMHGNVLEWCSDWYGDYKGGASVNPGGPETAAARVLRGGSWISRARYARSASRSSYRPDSRYYYIGFRFALGQNGAGHDKTGK